MKGLLLRLSALDADAESAVRVIGFFDTLVARKVGLDALVRSAAALAECLLGLHAPGRGICLRADPTGQLRTSGRVPAGAVVRESADGAVVWLKRGGAQLPLDEIVLERFAIAASVLLDHGPPLPELGDPALVELVLADSVGEAEQSRALHLLGLTPTKPLRVLAIAGPAEGTGKLLAWLGERASWIRHAPLGTLTAALLPGAALTNDVEVPAEVRVGVGPSADAIAVAQSWRGARTALRFTGTNPIVWSENLGGRALLADALSAADIAAVEDVIRLDRLAAEPSGADLLLVLQAFCATDSMRKAAAAVYRHHSTVASRLAHAERVLGFAVDTPDGRFRLKLAMLLRTLRND